MKGDPSRTGMVDEQNMLFCVIVSLYLAQIWCETPSIRVFFFNQPQQHELDAQEV
jgi:hypothetical protein